ncbi:MAG TPA: polysaccharide biosynthesis tyrosine autokinase, partial [Humisphaera sp.]
ANAGAARPALPEILWRRRGVALSVFGACVAGALLYLILATPKYLGTSRLYVQQTGPRILTAESAQGNAFAGNDSYLYTQAELLRSVPILADALSRPGVSQLKLFDGVDNKLDHLKEKLDVTVGKKDEIISVAYAAVDPDEAAKLVNAIVESFVRFNSNQKRSTASEVLKILQAEKGRREVELARQNQQALEFKQLNGSAFFETDKGIIAAQDLAAASQQLIAARMQTKAAQAMYQASNSKTYTFTNMVEAEAREAEFQKVVDGLQAQLAEIIAVRNRYDQLQNELQRTQKLLDQLDARIKELDVTGDAPLNITILEVARAEDKPAYPRRLLTVALAVVVGMTLGSAAAVGAEWLDNRVRTPDEVSELLDLPVLAVVPVSADERGKGGKADRDRRVIAAPGSAAAEAYRGLRTALHFGATDRRVRTILVTSAGPGDGKSTTAANLAVALAKAGRRVLLVDADLRKPVQHTVFAAAAGTGLSDVLAYGLEALPEAVRPTDVPGLSLLPCGSIPPNPSELLNAEALPALLDAAADAYDLVVIDSAPVLAVSDARIIAAQCDATLMVVRALKSTRRGSVQACNSLLHVGARMTGVVMNAVPSTREIYGTGYYGGYGYYRHADDAPAAKALLAEAAPAPNGKANGNGHHNGNGNGNGNGKHAAPLEAADAR